MESFARVQTLVAAGARVNWLVLFELIVVWLTPAAIKACRIAAL